MLKVNYRLVLFYLLTIISNVYGGSEICITGKVIDQYSKEALPNANIKIVNTYSGTACNSEGYFEMTLDSARYKIKISYLGYQSKVVEINRSSYNMVIELLPTAVEINTVEVFAYNWIERFMLDAIKVKNELNDSLHNFTAYTYSKTSFKFPAPRNEIFGMWESVSKISFVYPDKYQEHLLNLHTPPQFKNFPYKFVSINPKINFHYDEVEIYNLSILSPLADNALDYYTYSVNRQFFDGTDTLIVVDIIPLLESKPLFKGTMTFDKAKKILIETELFGNESANSPTADSISVLQKYEFLDSIFNLPSFTKYKFKINYMGFLFYYIQDYTNIDFDINNQQNVPTILNADNNIIIDPDIVNDVELPRNKSFKIAFDEVEINYKKREEEIMNAPLYKKALLYIFSDMLPLILDEPAEIAGLKISKLSNWYHFNKVEGHYIGLEFMPVSFENINLYVNGGWSFGNKMFNANIRTRYNNCVVGYEHAIQNIGGVNTNKSIQTFDALINHVDNLHYYISDRFYLSFSKELSSKFNLVTNLVFEYQKGLDNTTNYSVFNKKEKYSGNYHISNYKNNYLTLQLNYTENKNRLYGEPINFVDKSYLNISAGISASNPDLLNSTEKLWEIDFSLKKVQSIYKPASIDLEINYKYQTETNFVQKMNFVSSNQALSSVSNMLSFYSLNNYEFYLENYINVKGNVVLFGLPEILNFRAAVGIVLSYLHPSGNKSFEGFTRLKEDFWEYGISLQGLSLLNLYLVKNNLNNSINFALDFSF